MPNDLTRTTRARNADREATCAVLDSAFADGQLTATEHDELTELASVAVTLGDLEDLTSDLQTEASLPILRKEPSLDSRWIALAIIALSLVSAIGFGIKYVASDVTIFSSPEPQLHTVDGLGAMFRAIETEYGSGLVDEMTIYPTYARITRADPAAPRKALDSYYRGDLEDTTSGGSRELDVAQIDVTQLDPRIVIALLDGAGTTTSVQNPTTRYVSVESTDTVPTIEIHVGNDLEESGYLTAGLDGEIMSIYPFTP
ncbi:hypothetical protein DBV08_09545 [Rhodococcus sp. KBW08]|uniref:DUF1707 SHOCT-like domain-containing protein n=1 Tax=unclassified Rhodococcus (in: high G+C Gram-positive bacteria) TaxID=192944 RepID=UPI000F5B0FAF|nr:MULTISPECIES: DUF1707 domain-containing protein [unclassified Rhodococcus (in: high G+C Gram-positive bacteria)]MBJ7481503.1 DUF1707 domain-containing protein [Rhodococcus sp. (in: high G+C Gram-positive bacteria)]RQO49376.1 hypothetical protein DBV08_09545 [Rhodococcus sp. KBW08]